MEKLVSIVLPTYNGEKFLENSIKSVINQTYQNWELIIVNDASTDNTAEILKKYSKLNSKIRVITNEKNRKLPASLNIGFKEARGEYFTWTSDDNMYKNNALEYMVNYLTNHPLADLVSCNFDFIKENGEFEKEFVTNQERSAVRLAYGCNVGACFMYRRQIAEKVGDYDTKMFCAEDYDYWCRIALAGTIDYVNENLYIYRRNSKSLTATKSKRIGRISDMIRFKYATSLFTKYNIPTEQRVNNLMSRFISKHSSSWLILSCRQSLAKSLMYWIKYLKNRKS